MGDAASLENGPNLLGGERIEDDESGNAGEVNPAVDQQFGHLLLLLCFVGRSPFRRVDVGPVQLFQAGRVNEKVRRIVAVRGGVGEDAGLLLEDRQRDA
jgi:hypothetical protein